MTRAELLARRNHIYRRTPQRRLGNEHDALDFINEVGFCFLFTSEDCELPTLYEAILGDEMRNAGWRDREIGIAWQWKDTLPARRDCFYGKLLRAKPVLVSLDLFPHFYAISGNYGELDQYLDEYREGKLSLAAKLIYEALLYHGAMPTSTLRRRANLPGRENARAFERGLVELQMGLKIVKTGISDANRWHYCYVYDLLPRWLPEQMQRGLAIKSRDAYPVILRQYLRDVIVTTPANVSYLFGWSAETTERTIAALVTTGEVSTSVVVDGLDGTWIGTDPSTP